MSTGLGDELDVVAGAVMSSMSWGCAFEVDPAECNVYDSTAREVDQFMYDHPEFLVLTAAGAP